jgi:hypothetical protein
VLYAAARLTDPSRREPQCRDWLLLTATTAALLLAGHPETIVYALLLLAAFVGLRLLALGQATRLATGRRTVAALLLAGLVTAPVLLPTALYLPTTARAAGIAEAPEGRGPGLRALVPTLAPNAFGNSRYAHYWGPANSNEDASAFVGTATLLAALLTLSGGSGRRRLPQEALFLAVAVVGAVAVAQPGWLGGGVHGFGRLRLLLAFALAYLAACTVERYRRGEGPHALWVIGIAVGLAAAHRGIYRGFPHPDDPALLEILRHGWLLWHLRFLGAAAGLLIVWWALDRWRPLARFARPRFAGAVVMVAFPLLVAAELLLAHRDVHPPMPRSLAFPETPALVFLKNHLVPGERFAALGGALPPNLAQLYDLPDARIYNPVEPLALRRKLAPITEYPAGEVPHLTAADHPLYDELNVAYLLTDPDWVPPSGVGLEQVHAGPDAQVYRRADHEGPALPFRHPVGARLSLRWQVPESRTVTLPISRGATLAGDGWRVLVNGERAALLPGTPWVSFQVPPGAVEINLIYRPPGFLLGFLLAALGLAFGAGWLTLSRRPGPRGSSSRAGDGSLRFPRADDPSSPSRRLGDPAGGLPG